MRAPRGSAVVSCAEGGRGPISQRRLARTLAGIAAAVAAAVLFAAIAAVSFQVALRWHRRTTTVAVPDLKSLGRAAAERAASAAGLGFEVSGERYDPSVPAGSVLQQGPPPGALVRRHRKVRVVLSLGQQVFAVPDVTGRPAREAEARIRQEGLESGEEARVPSWAAPEGMVLAQWPPAGSPAVAGSRVHRLVSEGPEPQRWIMPDLTGRTLSAAARWIETSGFRRGAVRRVASGAAAPGVVVGQWPLAGYPVRPRAAIELTVAD